MKELPSHLVNTTTGKLMFSLVEHIVCVISKFWGVIWSFHDLFSGVEQGYYFFKTRVARAGSDGAASNVVRAI